MSEEEKYNDIEQLMYRELVPDRYCYIHNYIIDLKSQLQQKDNIIKKNELIFKALHKNFSEHEEYEYNEFLRRLESCTDNDMVWLKKMAGENDG